MAMRNMLVDTVVFIAVYAMMIVIEERSHSIGIISVGLLVLPVRAGHLGAWGSPTPSPLPMHCN